MTDLIERTLRQLEEQRPGRISRPGDDDYAAATAIWAKPVGAMPRAVIHCRTPQDVQAAIRAARMCDLALSVRGGGHDWAGRALCDGLVIDLRGMNHVEADLGNRRRANRARRRHRRIACFRRRGGARRGGPRARRHRDRVAVFADPPSGDDREFIPPGSLKRILAQGRCATRWLWLGCMQIPVTEAKTRRRRADVSKPWCDQHRFRSIVFVAARDHSRRWRRSAQFEL